MSILGIVILAVGVLLLIFGLNASRTVKEKVVEGFTGRFTEKTMWYLIGGIAMIIAGGALFILGGGY